MTRRDVPGATTAAVLVPRALGAQTATTTAGVLPAEIAAEMFYAGGSIDVGLSDLVSVVNAHARGIELAFLAPGISTSWPAVLHETFALTGLLSI